MIDIEQQLLRLGFAREDDYERLVRYYGADGRRLTVRLTDSDSVVVVVESLDDDGEVAFSGTIWTDAETVVAVCQTMLAGAGGQS